MNKKQIANAIVGIIAGLSGVASIITGMIAAKDDHDTLVAELDERYERKGEFNNLIKAITDANDEDED